MPPVINVHTHFQPEAALEVVKPYGIEMIQDEDDNWIFRSGSIEYKVPGVGGGFWGADLDGQLAQMDANGVDIHVLQPSPMIFGYHLDAEVNAIFSRAFNDETARLIESHGDRFWGSAQLPMQDVAAAVNELDHAIVDLGFKSCSVDYAIGGGILADERFDPFFAKVEELDVPVLLHPVALGQTLDLEAAGGTYLQRYQVDWAWGYMFGEAAAVVGLIFGGVLDRFPNLRFMVPHGGGMIPYQIGRLRMHAEHLAGAEGSQLGLERSIDDYLKRNFYFDTVLHDPRSLRFLIEIVGPENVVLGTNYPGWDHLAGWDLVRSLEGVSDAEKDAILGVNSAERLFR